MQDNNNTSAANNASAKTPAFTFQDLAALESSPYTQYRHMYVDICDDLVAGILLSKIVYWFGIGRNGEQRAKHTHEGRACIVKKREDWWQECRISERQYDRAIVKLIDLGVISTEIHYNPFSKQSMQRATFIFINEEALMVHVQRYLESRKVGDFSNHQTVISEVPDSGLLEITNSGFVHTAMNTSMNTSQSERRTPEISNPKKEKKLLKPPKPEKISFRENVLLTQEEHDKLLAEVGAEQFDWMLDELNCKKASNGYVYDCDAATMWKNGWVRKAWNDHISKPQVSRPGSAPPAGNEELAKKAEKEWVSTLNPPHAKIEITYDSIRIIPQYGMHSQEKFLKFSEDAFSQKIENFMRNAGFVKRKA